MNDTLKVAGRIGAELGAEKAEVERLRGLLREAVHCCPDEQLRNEMREALSQQAEPTDTYTAADMATAAAQGFRDGQAAVEQAVVQDEQPAVFWVLFDATGPERFIKKDVSDGTLAFFDSEDEAQRAKRRHPGTDYKRVEYYRAPIAQTAPQPEQSGLYTCIGKGGVYELIGRATTAGVLKVTGRFADEVIVYRDTESNALYCREPGDFRLRMARADLSAKGAGKFRMGDLVKKSTGSEWEGRVVGTYSTEQTKEGYAVESSAHRNSVQIYPATALEAVE